MQHFDIIVIGTGAGSRIYSPAAKMGKKVAVIENGPFGGTCLNRGCIPSKMLIHCADIARTIDTAPEFGIYPKGYKVDFKQLVTRVSETIDHDAESIHHGASNHANITLFIGTAKFVGPKEVQVGDEVISADQIFIAAGGRPGVPPIAGLADTEFLTSDQALRLTTQPETLTIIGGGYIACELGYFFGALGTKLQMLVRGTRLLDREDGEVADRFTQVFASKYGVLFQHETVSVAQKGKTFITTVKNAEGKTYELKSDQVLVATGRIPNSDVLNVAAAGIEVNQRGYITTNDYLETNVPGVYALGDIAGKYMFRHSANFEGEYLFDHVYGNKASVREPINYRVMPHAVFSFPQIAGVGATEDELKKAGTPYIALKRNYTQVAMGMAIGDKDGFIKMLVDPTKRTILGCHIIGHDASTLIHEVIPLMAFGHPIDEILESIHIHPALSELVQRCALGIRHA